MIIRKESNFALVSEFLEKNFSSPTHWPDWNIVVSKFYNTRFYYYAAYEKNDIIGICPVHETTRGWLKTLHSGQFHFIPNGGWIFNRATEINEDFFTQKFRRMVEIFSLPAVESFHAFYTLKHQKKWTLLVDLLQDKENIWRNDLHSKRRNMVRKAEKSGVEIRLYDKKDLEPFYKNYQAASERTHLKTHTLDFFKQLFTSCKNMAFDILWASRNNEFLSAAVIAHDKNYSIYWLGVSAEDVPNLGQGDLLQWEAIKRMKDLGCRYYDLCYIDKEKLPYIYKFKHGFSKTEIPIVYYSNKTFSYRVINRMWKFTYRKGT